MVGRTEQQERQYKEALGCIQQMYPGQAVLYVEQLAELFGKTEKALSQLIQHGRLPVEPRKVGAYCSITIFQAADWLAFGGEPDARPASEVPVTAPVVVTP